VAIHDFPTDPKIDALAERFPRLFRGQQPRVGSDLPQGWTDIANRLFADLDAMMDNVEAKKFAVIQIKEKFAGLRVYWELGKEKTMVIDTISSGSAQRLDKPPEKRPALFNRIKARVAQASQEAAQTCQRCGNGGASAGGSGWIVTLCQTCRAQQDSEERKSGRDPVS
jgi:hypothetical protein